MNLSTTTTGNKIKYKLVFLGDQSVGKSSVIQKYINNKFDQASNPTVGIDFLAKNILYKSKTFRLQLWDTAGQQRFKSLIPSYLKDAICSIIIYDVTNKASLSNAEKWLKLYNDNKTGDGYSILVGNKIDLTYRTVTKQQGKIVADQLNIDHFQISAKTGQNIEDLFFHLIDMLLQNKTNGNSGNNILNQINEIQQEKKEDEGVMTQIDNPIKNQKNFEQQKKITPLSKPQILKQQEKVIVNNTRNSNIKDNNINTTTKVNNNNNPIKQSNNILLNTRQVSNQKKNFKKSKCC